MLTTALQFSGGKDSLACLHLWRDRLDETVVMWVNTGAAYPETIAQMERIRKWVPHFHEVRTDQPDDIARCGWPTDVVPTLNTYWGLLSTGKDAPKMRSFIECCASNIWFPLNRAVRALGLTRVVRGQRREERRRSPVRSGHVEDGIEYVFPIEDWTSDQVMSYLRSVNADIPSYYESEPTSRDCWSCTAYLDESAARIRNLPEPLREVVMLRVRTIRDAVSSEMRFADEVLRG